MHTLPSPVSGGPGEAEPQLLHLFSSTDYHRRGDRFAWGPVMRVRLLAHKHAITRPRTRRCR